MKIKYHNWLQVAVMATMVAFSACSDDPTLYSDTDITGFKVRLGEGNYKQGTIKDGNIIEFKITPDLDLSKLNGVTCSLSLHMQQLHLPPMFLKIFQKMYITQ